MFCSHTNIAPPQGYFLKIYIDIAWNTLQQTVSGRQQVWCQGLSHKPCYTSARRPYGPLPNCISHTAQSTGAKYADSVNYCRELLPSTITAHYYREQAKSQPAVVVTRILRGWHRGVSVPPTGDHFLPGVCPYLELNYVWNYWIPRL